MIQNKLLSILQKNNKTANKFYVRNLLKEGIQDYILNFVYNDKSYKKLIFTGGTCLRKIYGLPRLSEDLDFDFQGRLEIQQFAKKLVDYFQRQLQYRQVETRISGNRKTVFVKFPKLLTQLGLVKTRADSRLLFVRCDFFQIKDSYFATEVSSISTPEFTFFVLSYDLSNLFANKISAFLKREFFRGKKQSIAFKGRDLFDLVWFFEQSVRDGFKFQPNWKRVLRELGFKDKKMLLDELLKKVKKINPKEVEKDLLPFIESHQALTSFCQNYAQVLENKAVKLFA